MTGKTGAVFSAAAILLAFTMLLAGCSAPGAGVKEKGDSRTEYVIRLGHSDTEDNLLHTSLCHYADWVNEETQGRVVIRLYPNEELGDNSEMAQKLMPHLGII